MPDDCTDCFSSVVNKNAKGFLNLEKNSLSHSIFKQMVASSIGSIATVISLNPINVIKVRLQSKDKSKITNITDSRSVNYIIRNVYRENGYIGFWSGTSVGILMSAPNTILYMTAYEETKDFLKTQFSGSLNKLSPAFAGAFARLFSVTVISPLEMIRTLQTGGIRKSFFHLSKEIVHSKGIIGLYSGWTSTVLRDCPYSAIYWLCFEMFRPVISEFEQSIKKNPNKNDHRGPKKIISIENKNSYSTISTFVSGASGGLVAAFFTHPFDVLKTQQQMSLMSNKNKRLSIKSIYFKEGFKALFSGLSMRLITVIPASAIMVTIYEYVKKIDF